MEVFLIKATQLILALAFLVIIHEFGHFLFARIFGVRVEKFYIFFNPWFSLFRYKSKCLKRLEKEEAEGKNIQPEDGIRTNMPSSTPKKRKSHFWAETEYGIGWLPLGGYCKIAGMIDESMDKEQMKRPAQPWEFRSKPAWQRLLIMIAGVLFNFLLAILIYAGIVYATGEEYVPLSEAKHGMIYSPESQKVGFKNGDIPLIADGKELENPAEARMQIIQAREVKLLRGQDTVTLAIPSDFILRLDKEHKDNPSLPYSFMTYSFPARITQVTKGEGADKGGVQVGDEAISINGKPVPDLLTFMETVKGHEGETINLVVARRVQDHIDTLSLQIPLNSNSKLGVGLETNPGAFYKTKKINYSLLASVPRGVELGTDKLVSYVSSLKMVFTKEGAQSIGGFGTIGSIFPDKWNWIAFWNIAAFLSVALAFMNILPIPALDGGHVMFLLYEVIFRRKPSEKFMEYAQYTGMILLILLLLYANGMDIVRLFK